MNILVFGAGAIGSAFGGFLSKTEHTVVLYGRSWHLERVRRSGLWVSGLLGRHTFKRLIVYTKLRELIESGLKFDLVLLSVKSFDTGTACQELCRLATKESIVVALQNGLGNIEILHRYFSKRQVLAARVIFGVELVPGKIKITVWADDVLIGETANRKLTPRICELASLFSSVGLKSKPVRDIRQAIWAKVIYNCSLNPLASLLKVHYGALLGNEGTRAFMVQIVKEAYAVAKKMRIPLLPSAAEDYVRLLFRRLIPVTYNHHPSMLQDLLRGRRTEIESLNGTIWRYAEKIGVKVPANELLTRLIRMKQGFA